MSEREGRRPDGVLEAALCPIAPPVQGHLPVGEAMCLVVADPDASLPTSLKRVDRLVRRWAERCTTDANLRCALVEDPLTGRLRVGAPRLCASSTQSAAHWAGERMQRCKRRGRRKPTAFLELGVQLLARAVHRPVMTEGPLGSRAGSILPMHGGGA